MQASLPFVAEAAEIVVVAGAGGRVRPPGFDLLERAENARAEAIAVDCFDLQEYLRAPSGTEDLAEQPTT